MYPKVCVAQRKMLAITVESFKQSILQDTLEDQIKTEKSQLTELESQIRKVEREVLNLKKKDVPELQLCEKAIECARNMDLLENRLYVVCLHPL